ncbi:MAG: hypothetical protein FWD31_10595, partial [Planctomycetaceae bacterium]|nr:hypothetical protein [Planctomycetaceae bacterium]
MRNIGKLFVVATLLSLVGAAGVSAQYAYEAMYQDAYEAMYQSPQPLSAATLIETDDSGDIVARLTKLESLMAKKADKPDTSKGWSSPK